jgi:hypothetical protein
VQQGTAVVYTLETHFCSSSFLQEGTAVVYTVEMLLDASADEQTTEGRIQLATIRKEQGNALFAAGEHRRALGWYGRSMALIGASADDERVVNASTQVSFAPL